MKQYRVILKASAPSVERWLAQQTAMAQYHGSGVKDQFRFANLVETYTEDPAARVFEMDLIDERTDANWPGCVQFSVIEYSKRLTVLWWQCFEIEPEVIESWLLKMLAAAETYQTELEDSRRVGRDSEVLPGEARNQTIFRLYWFEDWTQKDLAEKYHRTARTIRGIISDERRVLGITGPRGSQPPIAHQAKKSKRSG